MATARERLGKHIPRKRIHIREWTVLSARTVPRTYEEDNWGNRVSSVRQAVKWRESWKRVEREPPFGEDLSAEAEDSPLLEAVTRERLVKTQLAGRGLAGPVVICEFWRLAVAL
jgi:hypothetical protein